MASRKQTFAAIVVLAIAASVFGSLQPNEWNQNVVGKTRSEIHQNLGKPYTDFFHAKTFDQYARGLLLVERTLTIRYRYEPSDPVNSAKYAKATETERHICFGFYVYCRKIQIDS